MDMYDIQTPALIILRDDIWFMQRNGTGSSADSANEETRPQPQSTLGEPFLLLGDEWLIGRDSQCQLLVQSHRSNISRRHATIRIEQGRFVIIDHSRHGTYVNGRLIGDVPWPLIPEDVIGLASPREMLLFTDLGTQLQNRPTLTDREFDVLTLVASGKLNKEIALDLGISPMTVNSYLKSVYEKLGAHNRTEAVRQARKYRLL